MNESSPLLSFIPEQGPFHVFLNLKIYHFILERIYKETFGSVLPKKNKALQNQFGHHCCLSGMDKTTPQSPTKIPAL